MGSNMAENHPVGFQWVIEAKLRGATVIHVDPRFTRTSANATYHVPIRAGSDIAFLGGLVNYILVNDRWFKEYVLAYTNAATLVRDDFRDTEDLDGVFSGWNERDGAYDPSSWAYSRHGQAPEGAARKMETGRPDRYGSGGPPSNPDPETDPSLRDPRCVINVLRRHFSRYTAEVVERLCGVPREEFLRVAEDLCRNSGRDRTASFVYSVGFTQHTVGAQIVRTAAIMQALLGNIGRTGGGILALRGHASIQGSTDIPTLFNLLPGYIPMPEAAEEPTLDSFCAVNAGKPGYWGHMRSYVVSLLKAYWGGRATAENDFCFDHLPRIDGDHSTYRSVMGMVDGTVKGFFVLGENPAVGSANGRLNRKGLAALDWLVVRDLREIETATFWYDSPEIERDETRSQHIPTEVFFLPAAAHTEKAGSFTNTQRLLQWRQKAVEPKEDCRSELWFAFHLGRLIREKLAASDDLRDRPLLDLAWDYPLEPPHGDPSSEAVLREISGWGPDGRTVSDYTQLRDDGSTTCGCWIYSGCYADETNQVARRKPRQQQDWVAAEWGWAWPLNRRLLYNRASADPAGQPWSERKKYVWWDAGAGRWTGADVPDFKVTMSPDYEPQPGAKAEMALRGADAFVMQSDGKAWLYAPTGLVDGPLPTHYEPDESPVVNEIYRQASNPARQRFPRALNEANGSRFPFVMTTYRLTEHHTAGGMSRFLPFLAELQPAFFCEVDAELAAMRGLEHGGWAVISTARSEVEARVLVTDRLRPLEVAGRTIHQVGLPYHWGSRGLSRGDSANDLFPIVLDPNVHIQEVKAATCDIRPGRLRHES